MEGDEDMNTHVRSKMHVHSMLTGIAIGVITVGLLVPFVFGERAAQVSSGTNSFADEGFEGNTRSSAGGRETRDGGAAGSAGDAESATGTGGVTGGDAGPSRGGDRAGGGRGPGTGAGTAGPAASGGAGAVKVGILLLDLGNVSDLGFPSVVAVEDVRAVWDHWIEELNAAGGVNGRTVEPVYKTYDPLSEQSMREACLFMTEEQKVPLAVAPGGFVGPPMLCFTQEHATPFIVAGSSGVPQEFFDKSNGLLFTTFMGSDRAVKNLVEEVDRGGGFAAPEGPLEDLAVGILFDLRSGPQSIAQLAKAEVEARGYRVGRVSVFSADYATAASQVPVEVNEHRAAGVDVILNLSHTLAFTQFVRSTNGSEFRYFNWDWNGANSDFYYSNMPESYDGNVNFTIQRANEWRADLPEQRIDRQCVDDAEAALGRDIPYDHEDYGSFTRQCAFFILMKEAMAGADMSGPSISRAMQSIGTINLPAFGGTSFGPGRFDAGDHARSMVFEADCTCIIPISGFRPTRF